MLNPIELKGLKVIPLYGYEPFSCFKLNRIGLKSKEANSVAADRNGFELDRTIPMENSHFYLKPWRAHGVSEEVPALA